MAVQYFSQYKDLNIANENLPENMIIIPEKKISKEDAINFLRWHYEGTKYDKTDNYHLESPHLTTERTICSKLAQSAAVAQLRGFLPNQIGGCLWLAFGSPCTSAFLPWYLGINDSPEVYDKAIDIYDEKKAFWRFKEISILSNANYKELYKIIRPIWENQEKEEFTLQSIIEKVALDTFNSDKEKVELFLNNYSNSWALRAYDKLNQLKKDCLTKLAEQNN